jgi:hypothetical protein
MFPQRGKRELVEIFISVVERDHDRPRRQRPLAAQTGSRDIHADDVAAQALQPFHVLPEAFDVTEIGSMMGGSGK